MALDPMATPPDAQHPPGQLPSLDGLRAVSVALVFYGHLTSSEGFGTVQLTLTLQRLVDNAGLGVRIFFVISGFLITTLLLREERKHGSVSLTSFYVRRVLRIVPPLAAYLLAVTTFELATGHFHGDALLHAATFTTGGFFAGHSSKVLGHTWSLAVEEQFYLAWPFLMVALSARGRVRFAVALVVLAPLLRAGAYLSGQSWFVFQSIPGHVDLLMLGCLGALLQRDHEAALHARLAWHPALGRALAVLALASAQLASGPGMGKFSIPFQSSVEGLTVVYLLLSLTTQRHGFAYRALNLRPIALLGTLSYSIYVWQQLFLYPGGGDGYAAHWFQRFPQNAGLALSAALGSYVLVERPFLRLKERWSRKAHG
jgi:peptidoglycan/LPS O-acetylase OafA/YrhL